MGMDGLRQEIKVSFLKPMIWFLYLLISHTHFLILMIIIIKNTGVISQRQSDKKNIFDIFDVPNVIKIEKDKSYLLKLFQDLVRYDREENIDAILKAKAILLQIIAYFMETTNAKELKIFQSSSIEKLEQLLAYIDKHLNEPMTVEELADIVHLQVNYFIKFFKSHLGNTPMNYVKHQRLEKAKRFLLDTPMHISKVAEKVGYTDVSHFSNQFKRYAGMAPSQFRKYRQYDEEIKTKVNIIQK